MNKYFMKISRKDGLQKIERNEMYCKYINEQDCNNVSEKLFVFQTCKFWITTITQESSDNGYLFLEIMNTEFYLKPTDNL